MLQKTSNFANLILIFLRKKFKSANVWLLEGPNRTLASYSSKHQDMTSWSDSGFPWIRLVYDLPGAGGAMVTVSSAEVKSKRSNGEGPATFRLAADDSSPDDSEAKVSHELGELKVCVTTQDSGSSNGSSSTICAKDRRGDTFTFRCRFGKSYDIYLRKSSEVIKNIRFFFSKWM